MTSSSASSSFTFITSTSSLVAPDDNARKRIRIQAMSRAASIRRTRGGYGKHNLRQYPINLVDDYEARNSELPTRSDARLDGEVVDIASQLFTQINIPTSPSITGYERLRIQYKFDLLDLSALTTFHVTHTTAQILANKPSRLTDILRGRQWSYLNYLPSRIGCNDALDKAAECVAARVQHWLIFPSQPVPETILRLYSKALQALQAELDNPKSYLHPDVLCATKILAIYELLKMSPEHAWTQHSLGATALIKHRGAQNYNTEFEKALLLSQIGQIFHEALNMNEPCFLENKNWQATLYSATTNDSSYSDRSELIISLWICVCSVPKCLRQVTRIVCDSQNVSDSAFHQLKLDLYQVRESISHWYQQYQTYSRDHDLGTAKMPVEGDKQLEALGVCFVCLIIMNRLIFALDPSEEESCEDEAQRLAAQILSIDKNASSINARAELFMGLKIHVANTTLATAKNWSQCKITTKDSLRPMSSTIPKLIFSEWLQLHGWKTV